MSFYIPVFNLPVCLGFSVAALPRCAFCASSRQKGFPHLSRQMAHVPSNRLRTVVFRAGLKAGFCPSLASSGPVCPGIALLLAHCLAARPLPPAYGLGDGAKPPEHRQNLPVAALHQLWQDGAGMNESEKQFSFTRAAPSTSGRAKNRIPISSALALDPTHQLVNLKYVFRDFHSSLGVVWGRDFHRPKAGSKVHSQGN